MLSTDFVIGSIKWFDPIRGYGFVVHNGKDIFVHNKRLRESGFIVTPNKGLETGDKIRFKLEQGPKGFFAVQISRA